MNSVDELTPDCLGHAGLVYEHVLVGFINTVNNNYDRSITIVIYSVYRARKNLLLLKTANSPTLSQF